ncbi:MAG TPA: hypothetical protein VMG12_39055 [Polyangiaceae bacterium]|nr:hypothetical protein [Polyangiaceae bacterium]
MNSPRRVPRFDGREVASAGPAFVAFGIHAGLRWTLLEASPP